MNSQEKEYENKEKGYEEGNRNDSDTDEKEPPVKDVEQRNEDEPPVAGQHLHDLHLSIVVHFRIAFSPVYGLKNCRCRECGTAGTVKVNSSLSPISANALRFLTNNYILNPDTTSPPGLASTVAAE